MPHLLSGNSDLVMPDYEGNSIFNLSVSIAHRFGVKRSGKELKDLELNKKVVMVLLDGFGKSIAQNSGITDEFRTLTTVFPSTTSTVLSTIATGMLPAGHGLIGYIAFSRDLGTRINVLDYTVPGTGCPVDKLGTMSEVFSEIKPIGLELDNTKTAAIVPYNYAKTAFSRTLYGGSDINGYLNLWDALAQVSYHASLGKDYIFLYVPFIDAAAHVYGPYSEATKITAHEIYSSVKKYLARLSEDYDVLVTADHGHIEVSDRIYLDRDEQLTRMLNFPPFGDVRMISLDSGKDVIPHMQETYENLPTFDRGAVSSLFGSGENDVIRKRVGNFVSIATDRKIYLTKSLHDENSMLKGHHSSLMREEMEIPLIKL